MKAKCKGNVQPASPPHLHVMGGGSCICGTGDEIYAPAPSLDSSTVVPPSTLEGVTATVTRGGT